MNKKNQKKDNSEKEQSKEWYFWWGEIEKVNSEHDNSEKETLYKISIKDRINLNKNKKKRQLSQKKKNLGNDSFGKDNLKQGNCEHGKS